MHHFELEAIRVGEEHCIITGPVIILARRVRYSAAVPLDFRRELIHLAATVDGEGDFAESYAMPMEFGLRETVIPPPAPKRSRRRCTIRCLAWERRRRRPSGLDSRVSAAASPRSTLPRRSDSRSTSGGGFGHSSKAAPVYRVRPSASMSARRMTPWGARTPLNKWNANSPCSTSIPAPSAHFLPAPMAPVRNFEGLRA